MLAVDRKLFSSEEEEDRRQLLLFDGNQAGDWAAEAAVDCRD
jgi:hypothetical protein